MKKPTISGVPLTKRQAHDIDIARDRGEVRVLGSLSPTQRKAHLESVHQAEAEIESIRENFKRRQELLAQVGKDLAKSRKRRKWSLLELSRRTGISAPALSRIENAKTENPTIGTLQTIADALGAKISVKVTTL